MSPPPEAPRHPLASLPLYRPVWPIDRRYGLEPRAVAGLLRHTLRPTECLFLGLNRVPVPLPRVQRAEATSEGEERLAERLLSAWSDTVREYVTAGARDVSLSGGVDSAALCAMAAHHAPGRVRAWTMDVHFADETERKNARRMAEVTGVELVDVPVPDSALPDLLEPAVRANETVILNARAVASFAFYAEARRLGAGPVMLSGAGADEVLMGNPGAVASARARVEEDRRLAAEVLRGELGATGTVDNLGTTLTPALSQGERGHLTGSEPEATGTLTPSLSRTEKGDCPPWDFETSDPGVFEEVRYAVWVLRELVLPPELRGARAHGLAVRTPYLDPRFAALALSLPTSVLVRDGFGKWLFRHALRSLVPDEVRLARKTPRYGHTALSSPVRDRWLELYRAWLAPQHLEPLEVIDPAAALAVLDRYSRLSPEDPRAGVLDRLLMRLVSLAMLDASAKAKAPVPCPES